MNTDELPELVSRAEVRKVLRISESTLQRHFDNGLLQRVRIGRRVFVRKQDVLKMMQPADHIAEADDDLAKVRSARRSEIRCTIGRGVR
jgi:hypothetical protein